MAGSINFHPEQNLRPLDCGECEALFTEVLDQAQGNGQSGTGELLDASTFARFNAHIASCAPCTNLLAEARRGHDWMLLLQHDSINPPSGMVARILAETSLKSGTANAVAPVPSAVHGAPPAILEASAIPGSGVAKSARPWASVNLVAMARNARRTLSEPRFLMTAAMAFFSITLTFNLLGVHVTQVRPADLKPANLTRAISREYIETHARVTRYYDNLKIVYELEARVREFRRNSDNEPRKQETKPGGSGPSSQTESPNNNDPVAGDKQTVSPKRDDPDPAIAPDSTLREVALRHPQARRSNSIENLKLQAVCQRRFV